MIAKAVRVSELADGIEGLCRDANHVRFGKAVMENSVNR